MDQELEIDNGKKSWEKPNIINLDFKKTSSGADHDQVEDTTNTAGANS
jgi:hypothetical protein